MRGLTRLPEPQILIDRKINWLDDLLASGKARPDSSKYAHIQIKTQLNSMSFNKCFYCETKLKGKTKEIDHHIEVSVNRTLSYEWSNLYLSCDSCNNKIPHSSIAINTALDPCINTDNEIRSHLTFDDELIEPKDNSPFGLTTIQKYRLDSEVLDTRRLKSLKKFLKLFIEIQKNQVQEARNHLTIDESNAINRFKNIDNSYSLMFTSLLDKFGL
jgi:uncharacterized protein (TIGR02646 family)